MNKLSKENINLIKDYYKKFKSSKQFFKDLELRKKEVEKVKRYLKKETLESMDEFMFGEIISNLWATALWGNKEYKVKTIIDANGIEKIRKELINLLFGKDSIDIRYDKFKKEIKYLGPASITEILCLFNPNEYGIWNDKARKGLEKLGITYLPLNKYYITGKEYVEIINGFQEISNELKNLGYPKSDLLGVDYFLFEITIFKEGEIREKEFEHDEIRDKIKEIGDWLGFETQIEEKIAKGSKVDVIWRAKIGNLGVVTYVFEVHKKGSIDSLILNLEKALNNPTVQKLVAVTSSNLIENIKEEVKTLPENFRKSLTYWKVIDVIETYDNLSKVIENINKLDLIKSQFEEES